MSLTFSTLLSGKRDCSSLNPTFANAGDVSNPGTFPTPVPSFVAGLTNV